MAIDSPSRGPAAWGPHALARSLWVHRHLLGPFIRRDLATRYEGSAAGVAWSLVLPLFMLGVYVFVFGVVFGPGGAGRGGAAASSVPATQAISLAEVGLTLFSGMIIHGLLSECLVRAPQAVSSQPAYVKRVVFPLEVLPLTVAGGAFMQFLIGWSVLVAAACLWPGLPAPSPAVLLGPVLVLPLLFMGMGLALALSAISVYLRDLAQVVGPLSTVLLFLSPVFYPVERLPAPLQPWMALNPLTVPIEALRAVTLGGTPPSLLSYGLHLAGSLLCLAGGWAVFQATRRGFADVL